MEEERDEETDGGERKRGEKERKKIREVEEERRGEDRGERKRGE